MTAVTGPSSGLDARMQEAAQKGIESRREREERQYVWEKKKRREAKELSRWLHDLEATEAAPIMRAIAKAEKVSGHRLMLRIGNDFGLCSRGFRVTWPLQPASLFPNYSTSPLKNGRGWWCVTDSIRAREQVTALIKEPNLEKSLVYQGVDEWPTLVKICFWGVFFGFPPLGVAICACQHPAYNRAYEPAVI